MTDEEQHSVVHNSRNNSASDVGGARSTPNPRSCVTCRRRKVKCDKRQPCSHCARAKIECVFPGPGRAPRKSKKPQEGELLDRLRRLEGVVQTLNAQVEEHEHEAAERQRQGSAEHPLAACHRSSRESPSVAVDNTVEGLETRFGRLVVDQGRSRYVNNSFWASLNNEVEDLKAILNEPSDDDDDGHDSPESPSSSQNQGFVFGYSSTSVDMLSLHPPPEVAREFWTIYKENVDPLVKVLHIPSFEPTFLDACTHPQKIPKALESLMFTIYYGAITSLPSDECVARWGEDRTTLLGRYRFGLEQGLARANFLFCDEMVILQALVVFLILLRRNDDARMIWTLTGLAVRIAQTLGVHRDGSHFGLPPFEIEMRRRLWWQVCILDARASEDHGCDPTIVEAQFDTKMPLNVNDSDLDPDMNDFPEERVGFTDMTFCLIRFEVASIFRRILYVPPAPNACTEMFANLPISAKEKWISECHQRLEDKYLRGTDMTVPLYWVTATIARLVMSKMWLVVYHPYQRRDGGASLPQETKDKLFITSLENVEYSILLETEARTMKWGWLFRTYVQWHAIAFLLSELCVRTKGAAVERAWRALDATRNRWWFPLEDKNYRKGKQGCLWKPLKKLMDKARAAREREVALERASEALKNGGTILHGFAGMTSELPGALASDQLSPDSLDRLLRPPALKLGEAPIASPMGWPSSPALPEPSPTSHDPIGANGSNSRSREPENEARRFQRLSEFGLDHVIGDVMQDMAFDGTSILDRDVPDTQGLNTTQDTNMNGFDTGNGFAPGPATFAPGLDTQDSDPSILDIGPDMNWADWDDLVRSYGIEGVPPGVFQPNYSNHMGTVNWF